MLKKRKTDDQTLVHWIQNGQNQVNDAMEYILETYGERIKAFIMKLSGSREEAEDVLYEGLAAFILNVRKGRYRGESTIQTYITSICKGIWFKKFKRMQVHDKWMENEMKENKTETVNHVLTRELQSGLDMLMKKLKDKCKEVLNLWAWSYNMQEIAEQLNYSNAQVVMNKKNLCLKELRKLLHDDPGLVDLIK